MVSKKSEGMAGGETEMAAAAAATAAVAVAVAVAEVAKYEGVNAHRGGGLLWNLCTIVRFFLGIRVCYLADSNVS